MRKFALRAAVLLLAVLMVFAMSACSGKQEKILKVGVKADVKGFGLKDAATGTYSGMEVDLAKLIAEKLGYDGVEFTTVTAKTRTELLDNGTLDCVRATFTITEARKESWDFSTPYYTDAVAVLVNKSLGITNLAGLEGKKIGVSASSTSAKALVTAMAAQGMCSAPGDEFSASGYTGPVSFVEFNDYPSISQALTAGTVEAFCVDKSILANYMTEDRMYLDDTFSPQDYGVATKKGSELSSKIDTLITGWLADGTIAGLISQYGLD